jgi:hypothetical protein
MNLAIYFLALIGLIVILIIIYTFSRSSINKIDKSNIVKNWPPRQYMENVGALCPDYWVNMGPDKQNPNNHICMNRFNLDIVDPNNKICYSNIDAKQRSFPTMSVSDDKLVDKGKSTQEGLKDICSFIKQCGPSANIHASWLGIDTSNGWHFCP